MPQNAPSFAKMLADCRTSAVHLEMRDAYRVDYETGDFATWRKTGRWDNPEYWRPWIKLVADATARGVVMRRARIVSEPVTEYIRFEHAGTANNLAAGEQVRWLPRRHASDIALPGNDFWLFDDRLVRWNHFTGDGASAGAEVSDDQAVAELCTSAFEAVWKRAIPHAEYQI